MKIGMKQLLSAAALSAVAIGAVTSAVAQDKMSVTAQFSGKLRGVDAQLGVIERTFQSIESQTSTTERDAQTLGFEREQVSYAVNMLSQYDYALAQADLAMKSNGRTGTVELLNAFETVAKRHEGRLGVLYQRAEKLAARGGTAAISWRHAPVAAAPSNWLVAYIGDLLVPSAHAAIALQVYSACNQNPKNNVACVQAIAKGVVDGKNAKTTFDACWAKYANTLPKIVRNAKRLGCTLALTARLA